MKNTILFCLAIAITATAAATDWTAINATADDAEVRQCIYMQRVEAQAASVVVTPTANKHVAAQALKRLMIVTGRADADTVLVTEIKVEDGRAEMRGEAYRCEAR